MLFSQTKMCDHGNLLGEDSLNFLNFFVSQVKLGASVLDHPSIFILNRPYLAGTFSTPTKNEKVTIMAFYRYFLLKFICSSLKYVCQVFTLLIRTFMISRPINDAKRKSFTVK